MMWPANPAEQVSLLGSWLAGTGITLLELTTADGTLRLTRGVRGLAPTSQTQAAMPDSVDISAHSVGVFHHGHPLRPGALVRPGDAVQAGEPIGVLRVGLLLLTIAAPVDGIVQQHLTEDGATVGYGAPLLRLRRRAE